MMRVDENLTDRVKVKLIICALLLCVCVQGYPHEREDHISGYYPAGEEEYMRSRDQLIKAEKEFENRTCNLSEDEAVVDKYLSYLKWREMRRTRTSGFPASLPIQHNLLQIQSSEVYEALVGMPKGGNLHSHEDHQLSKRRLFEIVWACEDFDHLYIVDPSTSHQDAFNMDFFVNPPSEVPWIKVKESGLDIDDLLPHNTLIGLLTDEAERRPTDSDLRWQLINPLWERASTQLISNLKVKKEYLKAIMIQSLSEGVSYVESRRAFGLDMELYELDHTGSHAETHGKNFIDEDSEMEVTLAMEVEKEFKEAHPEFVGFKRISYAVRSLGFELFTKVMNTTLKLHAKYPEHVIGFDAVGEEDSGYSTLQYIQQYLSLSDGRGGSKIPLYLHAMETSWPEDLMTSQHEDDLVSTLGNSYDTLLLRAKRIGHGKGLVKKPYLMKLLKYSRTAVEVCPLSNQILGMEVDLRNHFGQTLHKAGIPIVLAPDDPGTFGFDNFTLDWYVAYTSWGLQLGDLKQIALNSLVYTGMSLQERGKAVKSWRSAWDMYIEGMKRVACERDYVSESEEEGRKVSFARALPSSGNSSTKVHIYGRNLERGICKEVKCKLGDCEEFPGTYISNQEIVCKLPALTNCDETIFVALDGRDFQDTGLKFKYLPDYTVSNSVL